MRIRRIIYYAYTSVQSVNLLMTDLVVAYVLSYIYAYSIAVFFVLLPFLGE